MREKSHLSNLMQKQKDKWKIAARKGQILHHSIEHVQTKNK